MTQKDIQLLLVDLSARLTYGVMIEVQHELGKLTSIDIDDNDEIIIYSGDCDEDAEIEYCKPYLRPMSSMTVKEKNEFEEILEGYDESNSPFDGFSFGSDTDWLNAHHFDYRGLIEKGLAIEVTEENNPYKVK